MNSFFTICNKRLDTLDNKIASFFDISGKHKEPPRFEKRKSRVVKMKDDNTWNNALRLARGMKQ